MTQTQPAATDTVEEAGWEGWTALSEDCGHVVVFGLVVETPCGLTLCRGCAAQHSCSACD